MKKALITGITGQDGAYLTEFLINKGYKVFGMKRRSSMFNTGRIDHLYNDPHINKDSDLVFCYGDMTDATSLIRIIQETQPDEIYNLAAQSQVKVSFANPEYTGNVNALGPLRILEAIRILGLEKKARFYQASTSEIYGDTKESPQNEETPFNPQSPYAYAKLYAHKCVENYRKAYGIFACNGILFNHESPLRGETFVTRKITIAASKIVAGKQDRLYLGNLDSKRDWGHARDYVRAMWLMLQQDSPDDYVIATGEQHTVREFCSRAFKVLGIDLEWRGTGVDEKGYINGDQSSVGIEEGGAREVVCVDPCYYRPVDVIDLKGDYTKAKMKLNWKPEISFEEMIEEMVRGEECFEEREEDELCLLIYGEAGQFSG